MSFPRHLTRAQKLRQQRAGDHALCTFGVYTLFLTPVLLGLTAVYLFALPGSDRKESSRKEIWPPNETAVSAAGSTEARTASGRRNKVFQFTAQDTAIADKVHRFSAANAYSGTSEADLAREFILNLGNNEAIAPRDLAKKLRCAQTAVLEAASDLNACISLSIDGEAGSYIAHPQIVARYRADSLREALWADNPATGDISLPMDPASPGFTPTAIPVEYPSLSPQ